MRKGDFSSIGSQPTVLSIKSNQCKIVENYFSRLFIFFHMDIYPKVHQSNSNFLFL